jgi:hypothetical protein
MGQVVRRVVTEARAVWRSSVRRNQRKPPNILF